MIRAPQETRTYFVTTVTANRRRAFQVESNANLLVDTLFHYRDQQRFALHAFVVMPDHVHLLLTPAPDVSLEKAVQFVKGGFSHRLGSRFPVWERSFNEEQIRSHLRFEQCRTYIELNPVRAHLSACPSDFPYSSALSARRLDPTPCHFQTPSEAKASLKPSPLSEA